MSIEEFELDEIIFVDLLRKLIGEARHLQNNPPEAVPKEDRGRLAPEYVSGRCSAEKNAVWTQ
jgi:hypothetical protein